MPAPQAPAVEEQVPIISPDGQVGSVPASQYQAALQSGYQATTAEDLRRTELAAKHQGLGELAKTAGEGALSGATFGLSDLALAKGLGDEYRQGASERAELNPTLRTGAELVGAAAPMLLSGGSGALGKAAAYAPTSLVGELGAAGGRLAESVVGKGATSALGRVAQSAVPMAIQGGLEGAAYGAGHTISENALGGTDITAEKLLAGAGGGALTGFLAGGALGAGGSLLKQGAEKVFKFAGPESLQPFFSDMADQQTIRALGGTQRDIGRLGRTAELAEKRMGEIAETVRGAHLDDGTKVFKPFSNAAELGEKLATAEEQSGRRLGRITDKLDEITRANPELRPDTTKLFTRVQDEVTGALANSGIKQLEKQAADIDEHLMGLVKRTTPGEPPSFGDLRAYRQDLDKIIYQTRADASGGIPGLPNPKLQALEKVRGIIEETAEESATKAAAASGDKALVGAYEAAKREFRDLRQGKEMAERWTMRDLGNRSVSPSDYATGLTSALGAVSGGLGTLPSMAVGAAASAAHNFIRERGSSALAAIAERMSGIGALSSAANGVESKLVQGVQSFVRGEAPRALTQSSLEPTAAGRRASFDKVSKELDQVAGNPAYAAQKLADHVGPLASQAPAVASKVADTIAADVAYVHEKVPKGIQTSASLQPQFDKPRIADSDVTKTLRIVRALDNPLSLIEDMHHGRLSRDAVQAVKDRRPELFAMMQKQVLSELAASKDKLSNDRATQLGILFGVPTTRLLQPSAMQAVQAAYAAAPQPPPGSPPSGTHPVPASVKLGKDMSTSTQRLEAQ